MIDSLGALIVQAVESDAAPPFDFAAIRARTVALRENERRPARRHWIFTLAFISVPCIAAAAALFPGIHVRKGIEMQAASLAFGFTNADI